MEQDSQLSRCFRTLEALTEGALSASEIGRRIGVDRSTALRMCRELESLGYVRRNPQSKLYESVRSRLYRLAGRSGGAWDWSAELDPALVRLRDSTKEATVFGVPAGNSIVYAAFCESFHPIAVREHLGAIRPMHASALGKAYLAALTPPELDAELGRLDYVGGSRYAAKGPMELRDRLEPVRERGFATDWEETFEGVACVAAPVRLGGTLLGAVGISGPISRMPESRLLELGSEIVEEIMRIERPPLGVGPADLM